MRTTPHGHAQARAKVMTAVLVALPEKREELMQTLRSLILEIRGQAGCEICVAGEDIEGGPRFVLYLIWKDLAAFEAHLASDAFRVLLGASSLLSTPAEFRFITADASIAAPGRVRMSGGMADPLCLV